MYSGEVVKKSFLRYNKWLLHYKVKLFSLLSAFVLWFFIVTDHHYNHVLSVSLHLMNQQAGFILKEPVPSRVKVLFRGSGKALLALMFRDIRINIDLHQATRLEEFAITVDMIKGIPLGMDVAPQRIIEPDSVTVHLDRFVEKKVNIQPDITLIPSDGYIHVGDIILNPDSVFVSGPETIVDTVSEIRTVHREFKNVIKKIDGKVPLVLLDWETVDYTIDNVRFEADIQRIGERIINEVPVNVVRVPQGIRVIVVPSTFTLKVQGGVNVLAKLKKEDIVATIDFRRRYLYRGKHIPAMIDVPEGITFSDARPKNFELIVER